MKNVASAACFALLAVTIARVAAICPATTFDTQAPTVSARVPPLSKQNTLS